MQYLNPKNLCINTRSSPQPPGPSNNNGEFTNPIILSCSLTHVLWSMFEGPGPYMRLLCVTRSPHSNNCQGERFMACRINQKPVSGPQEPKCFTHVLLGVGCDPFSKPAKPGSSRASRLAPGDVFFAFGLGPEPAKAQSLQRGDLPRLLRGEEKCEVKAQRANTAMRERAWLRREGAGCVYFFFLCRWLLFLV